MLARSFHVLKNTERVLNARSVRNEQNVPNVRSNLDRNSDQCRRTNSRIVLFLTEYKHVYSSNLQFTFNHVTYLLCKSTDTPALPSLQSYIQGPPKDWRRRTGRPRQTWLRTVEDNLHPHNFVLATARWRALDRSTWRQLMEAATST